MTLRTIAGISCLILLQNLGKTSYKLRGVGSELNITMTITVLIPNATGGGG